MIQGKELSLDKMLRHLKQVNKVEQCAIDDAIIYWSCFGGSR
jgi:hypothetical protein